MHKDDSIIMANVKVWSLVTPIQPYTRLMLSPWPITTFSSLCQTITAIHKDIAATMAKVYSLKSCQTNTAIHKVDAASMAKVKVWSPAIHKEDAANMAKVNSIKSCQTNTAIHKEDAATMAKNEVSSFVKQLYCHAQR